MTATIDTGLSKTERTDVAQELTKVLADSFAVYLKTHGYHWNVRGMNFHALHAMFMEQYTEMWTAIDTIAERIRALGQFAPQGYAAFGQLSKIGDGNPEQDAEAMLRELAADHETLIATALAARQGADDVTAAVIDARVDAHQKYAWMLRSTLGGR